MSLTEIEKKRSSLSARNREILEERLQGRPGITGVFDSVVDTGNDLRFALARCQRLEPLPVSWDSLKLACRQQAENLPPELDLSETVNTARQANRVALASACIALDAMGVFRTPGESHTVEEIVAARGILPAYRKLIARWMKELTRAQLLMRDNNRFVSIEPLLTQISDVALSEVQGLRDKAAVDIPAILTGQRHTVELIFSMGSAQTVERAYEATAPSRYFNSIVAEAFRVLVAALPVGRPLRILEVGAGVGGTTSSVLPLLPPDRSLYAFTDLSKYFLEHAKRKYQSYPFVCYGLLDINGPPEESELMPQMFDAILASNVLHCARFLRDTLRHMASLLTSSGLLIMIEYTENRVAHIILPGLLEGFSHFEDERLEVGEPLLSPGEWFKILRASGFETHACFPEVDGPLDSMGEHVI